MRRSLWIIAPIITGLCVCFGIMLPGFIFSLQDDKISKTKETYTIAETKFSYSSSVVEALENYDEYANSFECNENIARMSSEEAIRIGNEFLYEFSWSDYGYSYDKMSSSTNIDTRCTLAQSNDPYNKENLKGERKDNDTWEENTNYVYSAILWTLTYTYADGEEVTLVVDDNNRKVISFEFLDGKMSQNLEENEEFRLMFARYLGQYFDVNFEITNVNIDKNTSTCQYICELTDSDGKVIRKAFIIQEGSFIFK